MSPLTIILFSIFACVVSFWIRWRKRKMSLFQRHGIPGPKPNFITGNLLEFNEKREKCIDEWMKKYGRIFGFFLGGKPYIACCDIELLKLIQIKEYKKFINRDLVTPDAGFPHRMIVKSLPLQKDEDWKRTKDIINPNFRPGKIKLMSSFIFDSIKIFLDEIKKNRNEPIEVYELYKKLSIDVMCKTSMGVHTNVQNGEATKFLQSVNTFLEMDSVDLSIIISVWFPEFEPIPTYIRRIVDRIKYIMKYPCVNVVMKQCQNIVDYRKKSGIQQPDLLQLMINAEQDLSGVKIKLTNDCVIGNAVIFLIAGYDTTANTLAWCTYYIAKYPEIQEKIRQEINNNIESAKDVEYADIPNLKYLDQVISETLRLHSVSILTTNRVSSENFQYKNMTIPKNVTVTIPVRNLQKDPKYWRDSLKFDPERFSSENIRNIDPSQYQPFGHGPRSCIGIRVAQTVLMLTMANLIRRFKVELHGNLEVEEEYTLFIIRPKNGVNIKLTEIVS